MKTLIIILLNVSISFAINFSEYFDLSINNIYVYNSSVFIQTQTGSCNSMFRMKIVITDSVFYSGVKYFHFSRQLVHLYGQCGYSSYMFPFDVGYYSALRIDTANGMIYYYNPNTICFYSLNETMIDSLNVKLNDIVTIRCVPSPYSYTCIDTLEKRRYAYGDSIASFFVLRRDYRKGIGLYQAHNKTRFPGYLRTDEQILTGSVINGVVWGDTGFTFTGLKNISSEVPESLKLFQNHPNPFNPVTKIKFSINQTGYSPDHSIKLIVYDIMGHIIETLVNQPLQPGIYEVEFNGIKYSSGVYYYSLQTETFIETKKMVLMK